MSDIPKTGPLSGKRAAMVLFSYYPDDPRPRRAAEALVGEGVSVDLICLRADVRDAKHEAVNGVSIRRVPIKRRRGGIIGYLYQYLAFLFASSVIIAGRSLFRRYDLVYVHNMPDFLVLSGLFPMVLGARVILDLHDPMPELMQTIFNLPQDAKSVKFLRKIERWSIALADSVVTVNRACASLFSSRSCTYEKVTVVMNSPDERIFRTRSVRSDSEACVREKPFVVMYHGSLVERNGLGLAIDAFERLRFMVPSAVLRIYGTSNGFLERMMQSVRMKGLEESVQYMGPRSLEKIVEAIEECDLGIIPNERSIFTELNTPTRLFEYLALGKPVIAPRAAGIRDYFDEGSLIYFELGDAEDLARRIEYVFHNPAETAEITRRAMEVHKSHTWNMERIRLTNLVTDLLGERGVRVEHSTRPEA